MDWNLVARWVAAAGLAGGVFAMEWFGKAPSGTFLTLVAGPGLTALGLHTAAKTLN